jgi:molybdopterin-guanine dinucleotide biosynthesis protein A
MGRDKAELRLEAETLLARTVRLLGSVCDEVLVVGRTNTLHQLPGARLIADEVRDAGPLGGLLSGLREARHPHALVVSCDLPFLKVEVLRFLLRLAPGYDAVVPRIEGRSQVLQAVYARRVLRALECRLAVGELKLEPVLDTLRVRWVDGKEIEQVDACARSFFNVNTPEEWRAALKLAGATHT